MNIIYLRVSKEDEEKQDPKQQLKAIIDKFKLKEFKIYEERGSAYDLNKLKKSDFSVENLSQLLTKIFADEKKLASASTRMRNIVKNGKDGLFQIIEKFCVN